MPKSYPFLYIIYLQIKWFLFKSYFLIRKNLFEKKNVTQSNFIGL